MNELVDEAVARVLDVHRGAGLVEETDVFFTTDHGELQGDFGLVYKGPFHTDALMRLPFVWAPAPRPRSRPQILDDPVGQLDLVPTFSRSPASSRRATSTAHPFRRHRGRAASGSSASGTASSPVTGCTCARCTTTVGS